MQVKFFSRYKVIPQASLKVNLSWYLENTFERNELADIQDTFTQEYLEDPVVIYGRANGRCYTYYKNDRVSFTCTSSMIVDSIHLVFKKLVYFI